MTEKELLEEAKEWRNDLLLTLVTTDLSDDLKKYTRKYKEILNGLIEQAERVHELEQQNKNYRKVIKECVERMNAGGAGTRSFVYEKLIEVLEGESNELG